MKIRNLISSALVFVAFCAVATAQTGPGNLKVGAAKADISPPKEMFPMNAGQNYIGVHDPLFARAIVLDTGTGKAALVALDAIGIPNPDDLVPAITSELGITRDRLLLTCTHDHNAPRAGGDPRQADAAPAGKVPSVGNLYYEVVKRGALEAVRQAKAKLQPARVGFAAGRAYINTNRDQKIGDGYHMGYVPEGPSDKTVAVVSFTNSAGESIAVYSNYPVHAVVMFRVKSRDGMAEVTGDLPGATSAYVEDHFKNAVALWTSGAAGDQNPIFMANYNQDAPDVHDEGAAGYAILDVEARRLGEEIVRLTNSIRNTRDRVTIWGKQKYVTCPGQKRANPPQPGVTGSGFRAPADVKMIDGDPVNIPLSLLMINDIALAGVSGEVFSEIGLHLKRDSLFDRTVMVTQTPNGVGYIATDTAYLLPAEKTVGNRIKAGCAEPAIINGFLEMMGDFLGTTKP
jgi:neutral ceramidase